MEQNCIYFEILDKKPENLQLCYRTHNNNNIYNFYLIIENLEKPIDEIVYWLNNFNAITLLQKDWNNTKEMKILYQDYTEIEEQFKNIVERLKQSKLKSNKIFKQILKAIN